MLSANERNALNIIRWSSTIAIVCCHYLQAYDNVFAWVLNIGVQVFFFLSGFLYGSKRITDIGKFYKGRLKKIYLPYCIWVTISVMIFLLFSPEVITIKGCIKQYLMQGNLPGLNHLWFVPVIFVCYLILPVFDRMMSWKPVLTVMIATLVFVAFYRFRYSASVIWTALYFVGYLCGRYTKIQRPILIISLCLSIGILYMVDLNVNFFKENDIVNHVLHASIGILIFMTIFMCFASIELKPHISHLLTNGGGYELYLTHHLFLLGPLSILFLTEYRWINIMLAALIILMTTILLTKIDNNVIYAVDRQLSHTTRFKRKESL